MVSANAHEAGAIGDSAANHDAYLLKPVDQKKLLAVMGRELKLCWELAQDRAKHAVAGPPLALPKEAGEAIRLEEKNMEIRRGLNRLRQQAASRFRHFEGLDRRRRI